jgi:predicted Zn-dependent peptidase
MHDRIAASLVIRSWAVPGSNDPDAVPLDVFGAVLGGLASSRLDNALVREEKLAVQVSAGTQSLSQLGIFIVQAVVRPGVDPATSPSGSTRSWPTCSPTARPRTKSSAS